MNKQNCLLIVMLFITAIARAQGIDFATGKWSNVLKKAKKENKLVYVDVYTTWCAPCKILDQKIFPLNEVGDKFNSLFINYKVDAEKGYGIQLATRYGVTAYPTHLFIDPVTEEIIYRGIGAPQEAAGFNFYADLAMKEKSDPMSWDKYTKAFEEGRKDQNFLKSYLLKAASLTKQNDLIIDRYLTTLNNTRPNAEEIKFLAENIQTLDNKAVQVLFDYKDDVNKTLAEHENQIDQLLDTWIYGTFDKAVANKEEHLLDVIDEGRKKYQGKGVDAKTFWFRTEYYDKIGDERSLVNAAIKECDYLISRSVEDYIKQDAIFAEINKKQVLMQLKELQVAEKNIESSMKETLRRNPAALHQESVLASEKLNNFAWRVYEKYRTDSVLISRAILWSKFSMVLTADPQVWPAYADTYARLLLVAGKKKEAISFLEDAIVRSGQQKNKKTGDLEKLLKQIISGKLK